MTAYNRREFIKAGSAVFGATAVGSFLPGCGGKGISKPIKWSYAMCNESMKELPWEQQCAIIATAGYQGVEIAPFTLVQEGVEDISPAQR